MNIYKKAVETFGWQCQLTVLVEKSSELTTAAMHVMRGRQSAVEELAERAADVESALAQLRVVLGDEVKKRKAEKLHRLRYVLKHYDNNDKAEKEG